MVSMASSAYSLAKRAFVSLILTLGCAYSLVFTINRDSDEADVLRAYRHALLKVHPSRYAAIHQPLHAHTRGHLSGELDVEAQCLGTAPRNPTAV